MPAIYIKDVLTLLKRNGFEETRCTCDHHRFEDGEGHKVSVAYSSMKDTIPPKTYGSILAQMGLK
ncbi:MAG: type II toxin-antitoxin system HicA family toxin [Clostridiales Family XIII bacterium]|jgi:predicted RNA binding protein YcfA (HicA-like mRNA interferase family)|nr:type II toxin-antitoxin system HicA family toxin [Clostridiales Family XIII bacterium]